MKYLRNLLGDGGLQNLQLRRLGLISLCRLQFDRVGVVIARNRGRPHLFLFLTHMFDCFFRHLLLLDTLVYRLFRNVKQTRLQPKHHPYKLPAFDIGEILRSSFVELHRNKPPFFQLSGV